jgi:hypothetical protein
MSLLACIFAMLTFSDWDSYRRVAPSCRSRLHSLPVVLTASRTQYPSLSEYTSRRNGFREDIDMSKAWIEWIASRYSDSMWEQARIEADLLDAQFRQNAVLNNACRRCRETRDKRDTLRGAILESRLR